MTSPRNHFDVIVVGLGAMGSATAYHLALRGRRVLGLDRWSPGHTFGSSHGDSRIIREAYFEHPMYVPILRRAYDLWRELEVRSGETLLNAIGGLMIGPRDGELVTGTLRSAAEFGIGHDVLSADRVRAQYPAFRLRPGEVAVLDRRAGYLDPDRCNAAHLRVAAAAGATLRFDEPVLSWNASDDDVRVETSGGSYAADHLVLCAGARMPRLAADARLPLVVERQLLFWLEPNAADARFDPATFPVYLYQYEAESGFAWCYGFPRLPRGIKAAVMHQGDAAAGPGAGARTRERGLSFHEHARSTLRDRRPPSAPASTGVERVFRARVQVRQRNRRDSGRPRDSRAATIRSHALQREALCVITRVITRVITDTGCTTASVSIPTLPPA